jgi:ribonuclease-3
MREELALKLGIRLDSAHFADALTHPSYRNEVEGTRDNQRLEFLGDAVLGFCTSELLFARYPEAAEGELTRMRSQLVNTDVLAEFARESGVPEALRLGRGAIKNGIAQSTNALADAVEALIAAAFLDGGLEAARTAVAVVIGAELERLAANPGRDPKSELQERVQARGGEAPSYEVVDSGGPAHDPWFAVRVRIGGELAAEGRGRSKRAAERAAAAVALASGDWQLATRGDAERSGADGPAEAEGQSEAEGQVEGGRERTLAAIHARVSEEAD